MSEGAQTVTGMLVALAAVAGVWWLMLVGWRARGRLQLEELSLPEPHAVDPAREVDGDLAGQFTEPVPGGVAGVYASTTLAYRHKERIVVHGLGTRSAVIAAVADGDLLLIRPGARSLRIPATDLVGVRRSRGLAGKYTFEKDGLVVITWRLGDVELDTGVRTARRAEASVLVEAVAAMVSAQAEGVRAESGRTDAARTDGARADGEGSA